MWGELFSQVSNFYAFSRLFSKRQIFNYISNYPVTINMLITSKCNLKCQICSAKDMLGKNDQLSKEEIASFIKKNAYFKPAIFIGGGEPFMRQDIFDILSVIRENKLRYGIVTNGILLDEKKIDMLLGIEPDVMIFSIYGNKELHEKMTGKKNGFTVLYNNLKCLNAKRKHMRLLLNCVINEENYNDLEEIVSLGAELGVDLVRFEHLIFINPEEYEKHLNICAQAFPKDSCRLTTFISDIHNTKIGQDLMKTIPYLRKKYRNFVLFKPYLDERQLSAWYMRNFIFKRKCFFVHHSVFIKPNGDIIPCQFFGGFVLGNINRDDFIQAWRSKKRILFKRALKKELFPGCMRCCKL